MTFEERNFLFKSVIGAENYNLKTNNDKPYYKMFVNPSFNDLYNNTIIDNNKSVNNENESYGVHDIRILAKRLVKPDLYFLEALHSHNFIINENLDEKSKELICKLYENKDIITQMNLSYLYDSCIGIFKQRYKQALKNSNNNIQGYNTEQAYECWRILDFLRAYEDSNFSDFKSAIWYEESNNKRQFLIDLRNGMFTLNEFEEIVKNTLNNVESEFKEKYKACEFNKETALFVEDIVKELFYINLRNMPIATVETTY